MKELISKYRSVIKFLATGIIVLLFNLVVLFLFTDVLRLWYLASSFIAYILSTALNFTLQKLWVFENRSKEEAKRQFVLYFFVSLTYSALNTFFMYVLVDVVHVHYLISQAMITFFLATVNFFINRNFIFVKKS